MDPHRGVTTGAQLDALFMFLDEYQAAWFHVSPDKKSAPFDLQSRIDTLAYFISPLYDEMFAYYRNVWSPAERESQRVYFTIDPQTDAPFDVPQRNRRVLRFLLGQGKAAQEALLNADYLVKIRDAALHVARDLRTLQMKTYTNYSGSTNALLSTANHRIERAAFVLRESAGLVVDVPLLRHLTTAPPTPSTQPSGGEGSAALYDGSSPSSYRHRRLPTTSSTIKSDNARRGGHGAVTILLSSAAVLCCVTLLLLVAYRRRQRVPLTQYGTADTEGIRASSSSSSSSSSLLLANAH